MRDACKLRFPASKNLAKKLIIAGNSSSIMKPITKVFGPLYRVPEGLPGLRPGIYIKVGSAIYPVFTR